MMRRHDHAERGVELCEARQGGQQELPTGKVEPGSRFVEKQQARLRHERPSDQRALSLALRAVAETPLGQPTEAEHPEERVGAVDVEHREPLLEVADRARRPGPDHLANGEERREAIALARVDEADQAA